MTFRFTLKFGAMIALATVFGCLNAPAQSDSDFYAGKTISLVIGSGPGAIFDLGGRLMARFLQKHIPGNPTIVPRNMPGASSVVAAGYIFNVAPRDGLTLGALHPTIVLDKTLDSNLKFQADQFTWIGRIQPLVFAGIAWSASGVRTIADARKRTVIVSAQGSSGPSAIMPRVLNKLAGTQFRTVNGYESEATASLAMQRGEVQGMGSTSLTDVLNNKDWIDNNRISVLYTITSKRSALTPNVPAIPELAESDLGKKVLSVIGTGMDIGQTLAAPPGIPVDREAILRAAFDAMVKDPEFIAEAAKIGIAVDPLDGSSLSALVKSASDVDRDTLGLLIEAARSPS